MKTYLVVDGDSYRSFFQRLLSPEVEPGTTIVTVGDRSNATSMARTLLVSRRRPVALVMGSEAIEEAAIAERLQTLGDLVGSAAAGVPYKVILAVPAIESWFFEIPEILERLSGRGVSPELRELGEVRPKEVLKQLFRGQEVPSVDRLVDELTEPEVQKLRETPPRKGLVEFLMKHVLEETEPQPA